MFQHPAEAILGTFTMSVGDFEDFTGIFATSRHPALTAVSSQINPYVTSGLSHPQHLDKSTFIYRDVRTSFLFEPRHEKTNILHMRKQRRRSASRLPRS